MSKRKAGEGLPFGMGGSKEGKAVRFDDNVTESEDGLIGPGPVPAERPASGEGEDESETKQHTLDSDEEDNEEESAKYDVMTEDDVEGQEDGTVDFDDGEKITPFNMKEEMEEGHFDKQGNYFFKKDSEIKDAWLDNVDWRKIRQKETANDDEDDDEEKEENDLEDYAPSVISWKEKIPLYEEMISLMQPGENVFKAIKRLGGDKKGKFTLSSSRWKKKKTSTSETDGDKIKDAEETATEADEKKNSNENDGDDGGGDEARGKASMLRLTALADQLLQSGDLGVYESTVEKLRHELERKKPKASIDADVDDDDALDMFADEIDADKLTSAGGREDGDENGDADGDADVAVAPEDGVARDFSHEVHWWYRWEKSHASEEHGPFPSTQMKTWTDLGYFPEGVWLRKNEQRVHDDLGNLYNSERIDFDIYT